MVITAFVHHKGGTGKTTSCLQIAGALVKKGKKVLLVDTDPQANATIGLSVHPDTPAYTIYDLYMAYCQEEESSVHIESCIVHTISGIDLVPSHLDLVGVEGYLYQTDDRYRILEKEILRVKDRYDHILIDTPPFLGQFVLNGIIASDKAILVFSPDGFALAGFKNIMTIMQDISEIVGKRIPAGMALLNRWSPEVKKSSGFLRWLTEYLDNKEKTLPEDQHDIRSQMEREIKREIPSVFIIPESRNIALSLQEGRPFTMSGKEDSAAEIFAQAAEVIDNWS